MQLSNMMDQRHLTNVQADPSQGAGPFTPTASPATKQFSSKSADNVNMLTGHFPSYEVPPGPTNTSVTAGPPIMLYSVSTLNSTIQVPHTDSTAALRGHAPMASVVSGPTMIHNPASMYASQSQQAVPPGQWLQPAGGFSTPPFSPYVAGFPGPSSMPFHTRPHSLSLPDVHPPGVSSLAYVNGSTASSSDVHDMPFGNSGHEHRIPVTDSSKHVDAQHEAPKKVKLDVWTVHRTDTGIPYYYNALTGQSTYEKPPDFNEESADKAEVQSKPVSWERLANTHWMLVHMNDGRKYYYNSVTKLSSWLIPTELAELRKTQDSQALKPPAVSVMTGNAVTEISTPAANTGGRDAIAARSPVVSGTSALDLIKRKLQDSGISDSTSPGASLKIVASEENDRKAAEGALKSLQNENSKDKTKDGDGDADLSNSSSDSEEEGGNSMKEECVLKFKEMLKERGVAPFSKWDKELPKIVFDPRFKAIKDHSTRRALFEHYVRTRAEEERKEKRAALKAALEGFKQLLEEVKEEIDHNTDYQTFRKRWGEDPRFEALDRKERELLLNERVLPLKKAAEERTQAARAAAISEFKSMLRDKGDLTALSRWSKVKDSLRSDPRYKSVRHEDREKLFNEYIDELKAAEETARKTKANEDQEDKLKERERALLKRKEREEQEVERVRRKARRKEAVESYQALLVETIKDPQSSWTESKAKLEKDPQGRSANPHLDKSDMEKLFREHVKTLYERCVGEFKALLMESITEAAAQDTGDGKTCLTSWSTAKLLLKNDPRYEKMPRKEREIFWLRHAEEIQRKQKKSATAADDQEHEVDDVKNRASINAPAKHSSSRHGRSTSGR